MRLSTTNYKDFQLGSECFQGAKQANHCLPGDEVTWESNQCKLVKRASHRFIPGVLETNSKYIYGHTSHGSKLFLFHPHDRKYPPFRVGSKSLSMARNQLGLIEFMDWEEFETMPRGNLIRILGPCGDVSAEKKALTYQYSFPKVASQLFDVAEPIFEGRTPLSGYTFNIDPDGCLDIDDVFTLNQLSETQWQFVITISDVAEHILEGSEGDIHALQLGETLYQNSEAVVPMLPPPLSEMAFSLRPREKHVGVSLFCLWDTLTKKLTVGEFKETVFLNNRSYSYESIYKTDEFPLGILKEIAAFLHGSPTEDSSAKGQALSTASSWGGGGDSHEWVAEAMILYNKEVAKKLLEHNVGLLRAHNNPDAERLKHFTAIHPDLQFLAYTAAIYAPTGPNLIHAGLGSVPYCHASSPIRRYADLLNQRNLKAILKGTPLAPTPSFLAEQLNGIQKRMRAYERSLFFLEQVAETPSGTVEGLVLSFTEEKTKVYIPAWKIVIRLDPGSYTVGQTLTVDYFADLNKPHWDQRIVFRSTTKEDANEEHDE
jgi:exoribonuclease R